jgi:competence protein ComEC
MRDRGITSVFRFILSHADMDHMDGIKPFFEAFRPPNFWDTNNKKEIRDFDHGRFDPDDWNFYKSLRDGSFQNNLTRLVLHSGAEGQYYNRGEHGLDNGDGLYVLAPTPDLIRSANDMGDWNDASYVILYVTGGRRILFAGDSHDATWEHILTIWGHSLNGIDVLIAPHHGRHSDRNFEFLDVLKPKLTLFGNAPCEHMSYEEWYKRRKFNLTHWKRLWAASRSRFEGK